MTDEIIRVSHSQLNEWDRCRFRWKLGYIDKWAPKDKAYALNLGSVVHKLLSNYYQGVIDETPDALEHHMQYVETLSQSLGNTDDLQALSHAAGLVRRYITDYAFYEDVKYNIVATERHYEAELITPQGRKFLYELYFDLLVQEKDSGNLWMVDHKTHKSNPWTPTQVLMAPQLPSYGIVLRKLFDINIFGMFYNLLNTYDYKNPPHPDKLFRREYSYRTPVEMDNVLIEIGNTVDDMLDNQDNLRRSLQRDCDRCKFQDPCLMGLKGMDMLPILEDGFKQKEKHNREEAETNQTLNIV